MRSLKLIFVEPANRSRRSERVQQENSPALHMTRLRPFAMVFERSDLSLGGGVSPPCGGAALHHGTAARTDMRAELVHAGGDSLDVGDFMAA